MTGRENIAEGWRWLEFATEDLYLAQRGLDDPGTAFRHSCYLSQQATEKAIKGALIALGIEFLYRHDLEYLNERLPREWRLSKEQFDLEQLTQWAVIARYPGDWSPPTEEDAQLAVEHATRIVESMEARFNQLSLETES